MLQERTVDTATGPRLEHAQNMRLRDLIPRQSLSMFHVQILDRFAKMCENQPRRKFGVCVVVGQSSLEVIQCGTNEKRTGPLSFSWDVVSAGFQVPFANVSVGRLQISMFCVDSSMCMWHLMSTTQATS